MRKLFEIVEPFNTFRLKVSKIHEIYVEECGNPKGQPALFLHGGPGGGVQPQHRGFFDPAHYRIILVDQRGCGRSTPHAEIIENTTWDLVEDLELIRNHLKIKKWLVFGGSWGSTLALAYASKYSTPISHLVLRGIFLCRQSELEWFYQSGANNLFPEAWEAYCDFIPTEERVNFIKAYHQRLLSTNEQTKLSAAIQWSQWEASCSKLYVDSNFIAEYEDPQKALAFARIESHYFVNNAFFNSENYLIEQVEKFRNIPAVIIQGRYDAVCPIKTAWDLHRAWPEAQLNIIPDAGHSAFEPAILAELIEATELFKD